jgi:hypothetical protein
MTDSLPERPPMASLPPPAEAPAPDDLLSVAEPPAAAELTVAADPSNKLLEHLRAGKFSPEIAAQLEQALAQIPTPGGGQPPVPMGTDYDVLTTAGTVATVCVLAVLLVGFIGLSLGLSGLADGPELWVVVALLFIVLLAVVTVSGLKQQPIQINVGEAAAKPAGQSGRSPAPTDSAPSPIA